MNETLSQQIELFKSVFGGREDVFAIRWEKNNKSGYMPAYFFDPYLFRTYKMKGGTFQNYPDKSHLKLTDKEIAKHITGEQLIGLYPLLTDNTSWFLVADFDKTNWVAESKVFINACQDKGIPAYLERSRSGNGGHAWIFFEEPYPAIKSRKLFISILEESGAFSRFDKGSSFDRLFPNQDFLSGKGLGNLIALPLYKSTLEQGNSCFIDIGTLQPLPDQWDFLQNIKRVSIAQLDNLAEGISNTVISSLPKNKDGTLIISLSNTVRISRAGMNSELINYLKEELNFINSEFLIKKKMGKSWFGIEQYFKLVEETEDEITIPRGFIGKAIRFCRDNSIEHTFIDERKKHEEILFPFNAQLQPHQQSIIETVSKKDMGVIEAPPGSGKTVIALKLISDKQQPALIIVHRKQLAEQWSERIETFLGIPKAEIGKIGQGKSKIGKKITIATIQSLTKEIDKAENFGLTKSFGTIIVDECHHIPAETFRKTISKLHTYYLYGLTATPFRKYNDGKIIFTHLGEIIAEVKSNDISTSKQAKIIIRNTELDVPFNSKTDQFETLSKIIIHDSSRNKLILKDIKIELDLGKKVVVITERKEHIDSLYQYLKQTFEAITLSGEDSESSRTSKWKLLKEGSYQVLITTGQYFGEGTDLQNANSLFLVYPFSFQGKLIQYIGRVQRSEVAPTIYDYRDIKIDYLNKLFLKRSTYYRRIEKQATLFDEPTEEINLSKKTILIERQIKITIQDLEFLYGGIAFKYFIAEMNIELEFEIENLEVRPEFSVLKQYFSKALKSKNVKVNICAEFENELLVSQLATSSDIEKINREVIEGVKFKFIAKNIIGMPFTTTEENLLTVDEIQKENHPLYKDDKELLEDILKNKQYKHSRQLVYLADKHSSDVLKIRFVLNPFSFVFLITGKEQFHIIMETLDTEEATYLWHFENNKTVLKKKLVEIDSQLSIIRNKGRQSFLETHPQNFDRIVHDYTNEKKGFIIWKDLIEERTV